MNDHCVYLHKTKDGVVFYVGSGKKKRAHRKELSRPSGRGTCRGKFYTDYVEAIGFDYDVEIVYDCLSKEESIIKELEQYEKFKSTLVNVNKPTSVNPLTLDIVKDVLEYCEESPSCLRWKVDRFNLCRKLISAGDVAGYLKAGSNYWGVQFDGVSYAAHRIVAVLHGLDVQGKVVDHIDGNPSNNKISNLRVVTQKENMSNRKLQIGALGIPYLFYVSTDQRFVAKYRENGKMRQKSFCVSKYGYDQAFELGKQVIRDKWNFTID